MHSHKHERMKSMTLSTEQCIFIFICCYFFRCLRFFSVRTFNLLVLLRDEIDNDNDIDIQMVVCQTGTAITIICISGKRTKRASQQILNQWNCRVFVFNLGAHMYLLTSPNRTNNV